MTSTAFLFMPLPGRATAAALALSYKFKLICSFSLGSAASLLAIFSNSSKISLSRVGSI
jgi:hypothetical protein